MPVIEGMIKFLLFNSLLILVIWSIWVIVPILNKKISPTKSKKIFTPKHNDSNVIIDEKDNNAKNQPISKVEIGLLPEIFKITEKSVGVLNNIEIAKELKQYNVINVKSLPDWKLEQSAQAVPIVENAIVDRLSINIPGSNIAYLDIHELFDSCQYAKIFMVFSLHKFIKISSIQKNIESLICEICGPADSKASQRFNSISGNNCTLYDSGGNVVVTNHGKAYAEKEFQIHVYDFDFFDTLFSIEDIWDGDRFS